MEAEEKHEESSETRQSNAGRPWWTMSKLLTDLKASCQSTISHLIYQSDKGVEENNNKDSAQHSRGRKRKRSKCQNKKKRKAESTPDAKNARGTKRKFEDEQQSTSEPRKDCTHKQHKRLVIRKTERKLDILYPMCNTLLRHRLLRPEMVQQAGCSCGKQCKCDKWVDERPTSEDLDSEYDSSDLRVCHYAWGSWRSEDSKQ